jgi:hypothetical protein
LKLPKHRLSPSRASRRASPLCDPSRSHTRTLHTQLLALRKATVKGAQSFPAHYPLNNRLTCLEKKAEATELRSSVISAVSCSYYPRVAILLEIDRTPGRQRRGEAVDPVAQSFEDAALDSFRRHTCSLRVRRAIVQTTRVRRLWRLVDTNLALAAPPARSRLASLMTTSRPTSF